jgi:outer membrane lipoprotein SlyB
MRTAFVIVVCWTGAAIALGADAPASAPALKLAELCDQCAIVDSVKSETRKGEGGLLGKVGGAVVGGVIGHQIGGGTGKTLATVGGAVAGGVAGNEVQKHTSSTTVWVTRVTLKDGTQRNFETKADPGFKPGNVVQVEGSTLRKR